MKKFIKIFLISFIAILFIIFIISCLFINRMISDYIEINVPVFTKFEMVELQKRRFFDDEKVLKLYLSKNQAKKIIKSIENNNNWQHTPIDERIDEIMKGYTRENIYYSIPSIENGYWIYTSLRNSKGNKHSIDELIENEHLYSSSCFAILDIDNSILYYYEYAR